LQFKRVIKQEDYKAIKQDIAKRLAKEQASSPERGDIDPNSGLVRLRLIKAINSRVKAYKYIIIKEGSL
jgi:hypothetical protein